MAAYLLPSRHLKADMLSSATSQAGLRPLSAVPNDENTGSLEVLPSAGTLTAALAERVKVIVAGDVGTATFKRSPDSGSTYYGRRVPTDWDDGTGDAAGSSASVIESNAANHYAIPSAPCLVDTDDDGIPDKVFVAVLDYQNTVAASIVLFSTDEFSGAITWDDAGTAVTDANETQVCNPVLLSKGGILYLIYFDTTENVLVCVKSANLGTTWSAPVRVNSAAPVAGSNVSGCVLDNNLLCVSWVQDDGTYDQVYIATSPNDTDWTSKNVSVSATTSYLSACVVQTTGSTTLVYQEHATNIVCNKSTSKNPALSTAVWAAETTSGFDTENENPSACAAPDGTVYVVTHDIAGTKLEYVTRSTAAAYSAAADVFSSNDPNYPGVASIGGALWCAFWNDPSDITQSRIASLVQTQYWGTYHATNYPAAKTGYGNQFFGSGLWCAFDGSDAAAGDTWDIASLYDYGADLMCLLTPSRPARSTADGGDWAVVFDFGANVLASVDTIAAIANVGHMHVQFNATDSWGSPSVNTTVSFDRETVAAYTATAGKVARSSGTWTPHQWAGYRLRFGAIGAGATVYYIKDNDATALYVDADLSAASGDLTIMSPRAWVTQTAAAYRYMRVLIEAQDTYEEYYEVKALAVGCRTALATQHVCHVGWTVPGDDFGMRTGTFIRSVAGASRRAYVLDMVGIVPAEYQEVQSILAQQGARPLALIPDISNAYDWVPVLPPLAVNWRRPRTALPLIEVA